MEQDFIVKLNVSRPIYQTRQMVVRAGSQDEARARVLAGEGTLVSQWDGEKEEQLTVTSIQPRPMDSREVAEYLIHSGASEGVLPILRDLARQLGVPHERLEERFWYVLLAHLED